MTSENAELRAYAKQLDRQLNAAKLLHRADAKRAARFESELRKRGSGDGTVTPPSAAKRTGGTPSSSAVNDDDADMGTMLQRVRELQLEVDSARTQAGTAYAERNSVSRQVKALHQQLRRVTSDLESVRGELDVARDAFRQDLARLASSVSGEAGAAAAEAVDHLRADAQETEDQLRGELMDARDGAMEHRKVAELCKTALHQLTAHVQVLEARISSLGAEPAPNPVDVDALTARMAAEGDDVAEERWVAAAGGPDDSVRGSGLGDGVARTPPSSSEHHRDRRR